MESETNKNGDLSEKQLSLDVEKNFSEKILLNKVPDVPNVPLNLSLAIDPVKEEITNARATIDNALATCRANPGALFSDEFIEAVKIIRRLKPDLWAEYRVRLKREKPSGVKLSDLDDATAIDSGNGGGKDSTAEELIELVINNGELFFDHQADRCFVSTAIDEVSHILAIGSKTFIEWLSFSYYRSTKSGGSMGKSAGESAIKQACFALAGIAKHEGERQRVYLLVADFNNGHYLYIGDEKLQVIEILSSGWRVLDKSPVKFWKPSSMQALPIPKKGGGLEQLWSFLNIPENDHLLVLAWVLESYRSETPKPILALCGAQGSAKSSTQNKLRQLIDNNSVNLRASPKNIEDVFVSAGCNWLASLENISRITPSMQDALCTLATGGGFASRTLFTNTEETVIEVKRPVIINSIPNVITSQDLTDRSISIELAGIAYREESELNAAWGKALPAIFGGVLDLFVSTLEILPGVKLVNPSRMADFTRLGEAMAQALGKNPAYLTRSTKPTDPQAWRRLWKLRLSLWRFVSLWTHTEAVLFITAQLKICTKS